MQRRWADKGKAIRRHLPLALVGLLVLIVIGVAAFKLTAPSQTAPSHAIQPSALTLQQSEVGQGYRLMVDGSAGPTQRALIPPAYQKQFEGGNLKYYVSANVFEKSSLAEINTWASAHGVPVTSPPTIVGPYVNDHHGVFTITSQSLLYADEKSAIADFHCCTYVDRQASFANYHELAVHIGDEATAFGGVLDSPAHDPQYEVQLYAIRWRHGNVVCSVSITGSHDIGFQDVVRLAQMQDSNVTNG